MKVTVNEEVLVPLGTEVSRLQAFLELVLVLVNVVMLIVTGRVRAVEPLVRPAMPPQEVRRTTVPQVTTNEQ